jgi:hypothetical protein
MPGYFTPERRRRYAPILLVAGAAVVGRLVFDNTPRDQEVRLVLTQAQRDARSVRIDYALEGEEITGVLVQYPEGAPAWVTHVPSLSPGHYDVVIELGYRDGHVEHVVKTLTVPSEGVARLDLLVREPAHLDALHAP